MVHYPAGSKPIVKVLHAPMMMLDHAAGCLVSATYAGLSCLQVSSTSCPVWLEVQAQASICIALRTKSKPSTWPRFRRSGATEQSTVRAPAQDLLAVDMTFEADSSVVQAQGSQPCCRASRQAPQLRLLMLAPSKSLHPCCEHMA